MKILAIGDFHGKVPTFLKRVIKKEKPDLIVSPGDFHPMTLRKELFKHCYGKEIWIWEILGKKKVRDAELRDDKKAKEVLEFLYSLNIPIYFCTGNWDRTGIEVFIWYKKSKWDFWDKDQFKDIIKPFKNKLHQVDFKKATFKGFDLIGYPNCNWPGWPKKSHLNGKEYTINAKRIIRRHLMFKKRLSALFKKSKNIIFIPHNVPYGLKMSVIRAKDAHKLAKGRHYGSILVRDLIRKYQPRLCICGHMHENQGKTKIGRTTIVNCGYGAKGEYAIIKITPKQVKVKLI